jgi:hypothetical protein
MPDYPDNRHKFKNLAPWEVAPATPHGDNPVKPRADVVYTRPALRASTPPRDAFRVKTAPPPPEPEQPIELPLPAPPLIPSESDIDLGDVSILQKDEMPEKDLE